jgi:hypothetical protein
MDPSTVAADLLAEGRVQMKYGAEGSFAQAGNQMSEEVRFRLTVALVMAQALMMASQSTTPSVLPIRLEQQMGIDHEHFGFVIMSSTLFALAFQLAAFDRLCARSLSLEIFSHRTH